MIKMDEYFQKKIFSAWYTGLIGVIFVMIILACISSCASTPKTESSKVSFVVKSNSNINRGQPFYIVFRSVNVNDFLTQDYREIASMVFAKPDDPSLLGTHLVTPNKEFEITIERPVKNNVGVYGLFTEPGDKWKMMIPQPLKEKYIITLESEVMAVGSED